MKKEEIVCINKVTTSFFFLYFSKILLRQRILFIWWDIKQTKSFSVVCDGRKECLRIKVQQRIKGNKKDMVRHFITAENKHRTHCVTLKKMTKNSNT